MRNKYIKKLISNIYNFKFEIAAYLLSLIGLAKTKIFFDKNKTNRLEIGSGLTAKKDGFATSDLSFKVDYPYDLRLGLPFPNESVDLIYSEHVLEHFSHEDLIFLLKDCCRVLKPSGTFSVAVPNTKIYLDAYLNPNEFDYTKYCSYDFGLSYKSKIDYVNYIFYMGGEHRYMFDEDNILLILKDVGFKYVKLRI